MTLMTFSFSNLGAFHKGSSISHNPQWWEALTFCFLFLVRRSGERGGGWNNSPTVGRRAGNARYSDINKIRRESSRNSLDQSKSFSNFSWIRLYYKCTFQSTQVSRLVKVAGIIISASQVRCKATKIAIQCRGCKQTKSNIHLRPGFDGYAMPRKCTA